MDLLQIRELKAVKGESVANIFLESNWVLLDLRFEKDSYIYLIGRVDGYSDLNCI
jgi:hypothetical protein